MTLNSEKPHPRQSSLHQCVYILVYLNLFVPFSEIHERESLGLVKEEFHIVERLDYFDNCDLGSNLTMAE